MIIMFLGAARDSGFLLLMNDGALYNSLNNAKDKSEEEEPSTFFSFEIWPKNHSQL